MIPACRISRILIRSLTLAVIAGCLAGCGGSNHSQIKFVHAYAAPDASTVDALVDGSTVVSGLAFDSYSSYQTVNPGNHDIEIRPTGTANDLVNAPNVNFFGHAQYTIFFTGQTGAKNQTINPVNDDNSPPSSGNVKLRFFQAATSVVPVCQPENSSCMDLYVVAPGTDITTVTPTIPRLVFQQVTNYVTRAAGSYEIIWTANGSKSPLIDQTFALTAGQIRTLVAMDNPSGPSLLLLEVADLN